LPLSEGGLPCERRYNETGGLPWYREYEETRATKEEAFADAQQWAREYEALDRFGNMAIALGVIADPQGGWHGVVNCFHFNT
jgi:hypothetical protein